MAQIERQIEQTSANASARLQGLEVQRAAVLGEITLNEIEVEDLEQAQEELPQLAAGMFSVDILDESEVRESLSLVEKIAIALLSAFVLATILTFVRGAIWKKPRV